MSEPRLIGDIAEDLVREAERPRGLYEGLPVERPEAASMSLLSIVEKCPYSGMLYLKHKGESQSAPMARGELFHAFAETATNMLLAAGEHEMPPEVAKDLAQAMIEERVDLALPTDEQEAIRTMAWNWGAATFLDFEHVAAVESMFAAEVGDWTIRGKVDRCEIVENECYVYDYKTSLQVRSREEVERGFQAQFYPLLVAEGAPEGESSISEGLRGFHFIEQYPRYRREEDGTLVSRHAYYDRAALYDFRRTVEAQLARLSHGLDKGEWAASPGSHCGTCTAPSLCPIPEQLREVRSIGTPGEAVEVMERVMFLDEESAALKKAGKAWVDEHGDVIVGDVKWGYTYQESEKLIDKDGVMRLIDDRVDLKRGDFFKTTGSTRFSKHKVPVDG